MPLNPIPSQEKLKIGLNWWMPVVISLVLLPLSIYNLLLFHTLVELFAVSVAVISCVVAWHTYSFSRNDYLMLLCIGYFWVGMLDLAHTLTFQGMPFFNIDDGNKSIQLWIIARYFEAIILLVAPLVLGKFFNRTFVFILATIAASIALILVSIQYLPTMYEEGKGLTKIKIISEYLIIFILCVAAFIHYKRRTTMDSRILILILVSISFTIAAELCFTLYTELHGIMLTLGHYFKLYSFWAIYVALIESSLKEPFRNLAREANTYDAVPDETVLVDSDGIVRQVNNAVRRTTQLSTNECIGMHCHALQHDPLIDEKNCAICQAIAFKRPTSNIQHHDEKLDQWYEITLTNIRYSGKLAGMVHVRRNITVAKLAQERFISLNRLYTVLSHTNKAIVGAKSRQNMFQEICDIAITQGGFKMAWIGIIKGDVVSPEHFSGDEFGYLKAMEMRVDDSSLANGPIGRAAKQRQVTYVNDTITDPSFEPWRYAAKARGYRALAAVPLHFEEEIIGIFTIYSQTPNVFDEKMTELLSSLGDDISAAIFHIDQEQRRQKAEKKLHELSQAVEQSSNSIIIMNIDFNIQYVNRSFIALTGYQPHEVYGKNPRLLGSHNTSEAEIQGVRQTLMADREWNGKTENRRKNGTNYWAQQTIFPIKNEEGETTHFVSTFEDITELHQAQETIRQLAFYDPLTNLPNRRLLSDRLEQAIEHSQRHEDQVPAVMIFDLDNFKKVNDSLGHHFGDQLLQHVARVLQQQVRKEDTVSRQGGDEFTIILHSMKSFSRLQDIANNIIEELANPIELAGSQVVVGTSIGIAIYPQDAHDADSLLRHADMAMYHAKREGKNNFQFYQDKMNTQARKRLGRENRLRNAIENDEFKLHYQPQVDLATGALIGFESLIRWHDPVKGIITPNKFIPLAEDTGMIGKLGDWALMQACKENKVLQEAGIPSVKVAVNVSAYQFHSGDRLCRVIQDALTHSSLPAEFLAIELTESVLLEDIKDTIRTLEKLKSLNISIAIDDFGTGYSSLNYLKQFPVDILKIDQSFIKDMPNDPSDEAIVTAIVAMAHQLKLIVIAEGVETPQQKNCLIKQHCDQGQGYLFGKPKTLEELLSKRSAILR